MKQSSGSFFYYCNGVRVQLGKQCTSCKNKKTRLYYSTNKSSLIANSDRYNKTKFGFLVRVYRNMQSRVLGIQKKKAHLYFGKEILSKEDFYIWSISDISFNRLFKVWADNKYDRKRTPSIDRIDSTGGYLKENIQWITLSENSRKGGLSRHLTSPPAISRQDHRK